MKRYTPHLEEGIEALDARLDSAGGNRARAWEQLTPVELQFIEGELAKVIASPRYFLLNYFFVKKKGSIMTPIWPLWPSQEMFLEVFERQRAAGQPIRIITLKARQLGITTISVALLSWLTFTRPMTTALSMADEDERTQINFGMARDGWENLPWWMQPEKRYDIRGQLLAFDRPKDEDRRRSPGLRSQLMFEPANSPSGSAYSKSLFAAHLAEVSRYRDGKTITEGIFGSLVRAPGTIGLMESTARGRGNAWFRICRQSQAKKMAGWEFLFIEWLREPNYSVAVPENFERTTEEEAVAKRVRESLKLEITDGQLAWRREKLEEFEAADGNDDRFNQEFPLTPVDAFISSGLCAFSKRSLRDQLTNFVREPRWVGEISLRPDNVRPRLVYVPDGRLKIWEFPKPGRTYYVGGDPSLGVDGGDPAAIVVWYVPDDIAQPLYMVAQWHGYVGAGNYARIMSAIGFFYNTAELAPECNTITTVASDIAKVIMYPKWYRDMREDKIRNNYSNWIGWQTNHRNRNGLITKFRDALVEYTAVVRSEELIDQCYDFVDVDGTGRFEGAEHDDLVFASMIGYYCATQLRPRLDSSSAPDALPDGADFQNTDYSPLYDTKESYIRDIQPVGPELIPDYDLL